jgi:hypothetical protein
MNEDQSARYIAAALRYRHGRRAFVIASHEADLSVLRGDHARAAQWRSVADCLVRNVEDARGGQDR